MHRLWWDTRTYRTYVRTRTLLNLYFVGNDLLYKETQETRLSTIYTITGNKPVWEDI